MAKGTSFATDAQEMASSLLLKFDPLENICESLCGFHLYPDDPKRQVIAYHYCSKLNEDFRQCLMYDSDKKDAKLIGVEYIISEKLFKTLDQHEQLLWHSHKYEVESGLLVLNPKSTMPNMVARAAETTVMKELVNTYGKIYQLWPVDNGCCSTPVPLGPPKLNVSFTRDGQIDQKLLAKRDSCLGISTADIKEHRKKSGVKGDEPHPAADQWDKGKVYQIIDSRDKDHACLAKCGKCEKCDK